MTYQEPQVSFLILDMAKPILSRQLLLSLRDKVKFDHKVIYLHNGRKDGAEEYGYEYLKEGLIDQFIQTGKNNGLGIGTRDLFAASFSPYSVYVQNDQILGRDFTQNELNNYIEALECHSSFTGCISIPVSISLAGSVAGDMIYSERAHIIKTAFYKKLESEGLPNYGAGPHSDGVWREGAIQSYYKTHNYLHLTNQPPLFIDRGIETIRDNPDGSRLKMRTDTKAVVWITKPKERYVFPDMTEQEWIKSISGNWKDGTIPEGYLKRGESFNCWGD